MTENNSKEYAMLVLEKQLDLVPDESWLKYIDFDVLTDDERTLIVGALIQTMNALLNQSLLMRILEDKCRKLN